VNFFSTGATGSVRRSQACNSWGVTNDISNQSIVPEGREKGGVHLQSLILVRQRRIEREIHKICQEGKRIQYGSACFAMLLTT